MTDSDISAVENAVEALRKAMLAGYRAELERLTADELVYRHSNGGTEDKQAFIDNVVTRCHRFSDLVISDQSVRVVDNVALVDHVMRRIPRQLPADGQVEGLKTLAVWIHRQGRWMLLARHSVKV